jgi:hypothetical protein
VFRIALDFKSPQSLINHVFMKHRRQAAAHVGRRDKRQMGFVVRCA